MERNLQLISVIFVHFLMHNRFNPLWMILPLLIIVFVDVYVFQAIKTSFSGSRTSTQRTAYLIYWILSSFTYLALLILVTRGYAHWHGWSKNIITGIAQTVFLGKLCIVPFLLIDDILRLFRWIISLFGSKEAEYIQPTGISRLQFLSRIGLAVGSFTFGAFFYGIVRGGYNYQRRRVKLQIKDLPAEWSGLKIVQISDLHIGSFANDTPIKKIVELVNKEDADIIFFTGDLVNYAASEVMPYIEILKGLRSKSKIYSILGNHDYGSYVKWDSQKEMKDNFQHLLHIQKNELGWDLLMDENRILERNGKKLAIVGVQYIGHMMLGKIGNMKKAYVGAEDAEIQLLLSHDPSHWDHEISQDEQYRKINATFSGHTHGFQFGVEIPKLGLKWSPAKYVFPHWAGLYKSGEQNLYVNRGLGFIGYPGRLGIPPEITIIELVKA
ncbi:MAG: mismatch repair protein MutT [Bacteroidota bacterium]|nr:mismatch repair protein MutT [Bacteroidota bacterium]